MLWRSDMFVIGTFLVAWTCDFSMMLYLSVSFPTFSGLSLNQKAKIFSSSMVGGVGWRCGWLGVLMAKGGFFRVHLKSGSGVEQTGDWPNAIQPFGAAAVFF